MSKTAIPQGYKTPLEIYDMQCAIEFIKGNFQRSEEHTSELQSLSC